MTSKRLVFALAASLICTFGCKDEPSAGEPPTEKSVAKAVEVSAKVESVKRLNDNHWGFGHEVTWAVSLSRGDMGAGDVKSKRDLPEALRAKRMEVRSGERSGSCNLVHYPYPCQFRLEAGEKAPAALELSVVFDDGASGTTTLAVPTPERLLPAIEDLHYGPIADGETSPEALHRWKVVFGDVAPDSYGFIVEEHIGGRGNPYRDRRFYLEKKDGSYVFDEKRSDAGYALTVSQSGGTLTVEATPTQYKGNDIRPEGPISHFALCAEKSVGTTYIRECAIRDFPH